MFVCQRPQIRSPSPTETILQMQQATVPNLSTAFIQQPAHAPQVQQAASASLGMPFTQQPVQHVSFAPQTVGGQGNGGNNVSPYGIGRSIQKDISYSISRQGTEELYKFQRRIADRKFWKQRMVDRLAMPTMRYRGITDQVGSAPSQITKAELVATTID